MLSLLEKLKAGKHITQTIKWPGTDIDVALRALSNADIQHAMFEAEAHFKKNEIELSLSTAELFEDEQTTQILARALRDPEDPSKPFAKDADELRRLITRDEKDILVDSYNAFIKEVSPSGKVLSESEIKDLFERLKKNPALGNNLNLITLRRLLTYLASRQ